MLKTEKYKFSPFINNSFDDTIKEFLRYIASKYDVFDVILKSKMIIDNTLVGYNPKSMYKPEKIYVCVNFMSNGSWRNKGGTLYSTIILMNKTEIDIRWDTTFDNFDDDSYIDFSNKQFRKMKLKKLNESSL